jgi:hypothetical protein
MIFFCHLLGNTKRRSFGHPADYVSGHSFFMTIFEMTPVFFARASIFEIQALCDFCQNRTHEEHPVTVVL